jgi:acyl-CoA synthetase (AMP-forming)/AMP-acid ligase II
VELQEVDHALRAASKTDMAVSVAWPIDSGHADAIYGFVCEQRNFDTQSVIEHCRKVMPDYMVPRRLFVIDEMPLNVNGKIDRPALAKRVGELLNGN